LAQEAMQIDERKRCQRLHERFFFFIMEKEKGM
jgi:hypothetical protein